MKLLFEYAQDCVSGAYLVHFTPSCCRFYCYRSLPSSGTIVKNDIVVTAFGNRYRKGQFLFYPSQKQRAVGIWKALIITVVNQRYHDFTITFNFQSHDRIFWEIL